MQTENAVAEEASIRIVRPTFEPTFGYTCVDLLIGDTNYGVMVSRSDDDSLVGLALITEDSEPLVLKTATDRAVLREFLLKAAELLK